MYRSRIKLRFRGWGKVSSQHLLFAFVVRLFCSIRRPVCLCSDANKAILPLIISAPLTQDRAMPAYDLGMLHKVVEVDVVRN